MTNKELQDILSKYPDECIVMYRHNKYGRIDIDCVDLTEEAMMSGNKKYLITLEANFEED